MPKMDIQPGIQGNWMVVRVMEAQMVSNTMRFHMVMLDRVRVEKVIYLKYRQNILRYLRFLKDKVRYDFLQY